MRKMRTWMGVALLAILVAPAAGGSFDQLLPPETVAYLTVQDVSGIGARMKASPLGAMWSEEAVQDFLELPRQKWAEEMKKLSAELGGARPDEILGMIKGQVAIAFTGFRATEGGKQRVGAVVLADIGENGQQLREWMSRIEQSEEFGGEMRRIESEFRGTKIVSWIPKDMENEEDEEVEEGAFDVEPGHPCYFVNGDLLAFGTDPKVLEGILDRRNATDAVGLAANATYRRVRERTGATADVAFYLNMKQVWTMIDRAVDDEKVMPILGALGLTGMDALGFGMTMEGLGTTSRYFISTPEGPKGVMKLIAGQNSGLVPPKFVPTDVASAITLAFDIQGLWQEARRVMDEIKPGTTEMVDQQLETLKEQHGLDLQADLIGSMGGKMTFYQYSPDPDAEPGMGPLAGLSMMGRIVIALEITNAEKLNTAIETLLQMTGGVLPIEAREYMGVTMRVISMGPQEMGVGLTAGHLVFATNVEDLQAVIQTQGKDVKGLADTEEFARAVAGLPRARSMVSYSDPRRAMTGITSMVKQMAPLLEMQMPEMSEWIDLSLFPEAEIITKYMDVSGGVMLTEEDGISMVSVSRMKLPK